MAESLQNIKSRLGAVKNIGQITKAMEVVSATKMRKSQEAALGSRPYAFFALELLEKLLKSDDLKKINIPLSASREIKKTLVVVVASDRGLAGSFNSQIFRAVDALLAKDNFSLQLAHEFVFAAVGKKAENYVLKNKWNLCGKFQGFGDFIETEEVTPLAELLVSGYLKGDFDRVLIISTHFRTALFQDVLVRQILPFDLEKIEKTVKEIVPEHGKFSEAVAPPLGGSTAKSVSGIDYILEPTPAEILNSLIPYLFKMQVYHIILEANASEHSARRVAMKSAADNADEISTDLSISYNKVRQASITSELIEITGTQSALV
ncbi:ATP synthase F1 subunit gamma [Candidatus Giovannonibacteria bacterium RIFCSPHIGHO2_01_FULL_45_33]|uniref:ATP synthase gamma chain n=1 Tax=Candidatus Giovannonibacteria bacterium RIFCSPLOWO2_01_FULL_45_34 TaxID=1798351 RepID=A0A1F5X1X9_9BACT|nr:MAG: ATP synthase F1 subunit gamma [Candidatus Giovannonibacteria bacterium RIFCSPHIGHO2_01_FULL_45_33]OGF70095.1 MAG: ATP synthase F1 subunit gamma [Candidatus Giovannonibacteria bacterium RIFCSPHIGHO2_02_FULL_44_11]OGF81904.1 MAG: ATP synthase F1 subunit gamma [Candidatus Giovannonibacteria bacterium RIFCSPLOWO2_01_FULL_45_34]